MRFMVMVPANEDSEAGRMPEGAAEMFAAMARFNEEMAKAGVMLAGEGLQPSSKGCKIRFQAGGKTTVVDGPFAEAKELIAGYWIIQTKTKQEAIDWIKRAPFGSGTELQLRQIFETSDFPDEVFPPEEKAKEEALRTELEKKHGKKG
ncbi:MAG TPA: YciI family protein [Planctomycetota bacterium]